MRRAEGKGDAFPPARFGAIDLPSWVLVVDVGATERA